MMPIWQWTEDFKSRRVMEVEADTEAEAREKMQAGDWLSETEIDFHSYELIHDLALVED